MKPRIHKLHTAAIRRHQRLLDMLPDDGILTVHDCMAAWRMNHMTAANRLTYMKRQGMIRTVGQHNPQHYEKVGK